MSFIGTRNCHICDKKVYPMERMDADGLTFHKQCMRCEKCKTILKLGNFASLGGKYYCKPHFKENFKAHGNYNFESSVNVGDVSSSTPAAQPAASAESAAAAGGMGKEAFKAGGFRTVSAMIPRPRTQEHVAEPEIKDESFARSENKSLNPDAHEDVEGREALLRRRREEKLKSVREKFRGSTIGGTAAAQQPASTGSASVSSSANMTEKEKRKAEKKAKKAADKASRKAETKEEKEKRKAEKAARKAEKAAKKAEKANKEKLHAAESKAAAPAASSTATAAAPRGLGSSDDKPRIISSSRSVILRQRAKAFETGESTSSTAAVGTGAARSELNNINQGGGFRSIKDRWNQMAIPAFKKKEDEVESEEALKAKREEKQREDEEKRRRADEQELKRKEEIERKRKAQEAEERERERVAAQRRKEEAERKYQQEQKEADSTGLKEKQQQEEKERKEREEKERKQREEKERKEREERERKQKEDAEKAAANKPAPAAATGEEEDLEKELREHQARLESLRKQREELETGEDVASPEQVHYIVTAKKEEPAASNQGDDWIEKERARLAEVHQQIVEKERALAELRSKYDADMSVLKQREAARNK